MTFQTIAGRFSATLPSLLADADVSIWQDSFTETIDHIWHHETRVSHRFIAATGATSVAVDFTDVPGFLAEWRLDPTLLLFRGLDAGHDTSAYDFTSAGVSESIEAPPSALTRRAPTRAGLAQALAALADAGRHSIGADLALRRHLTAR